MNLMSKIMPNPPHLVAGATVADRRLRTQRLTGPPLAAPGQVVDLLCAMQSQEHAAALWSIGQRCADQTEASVQQAFDDGAFLRTHVLRPTWHFVAPVDIRWLLELTAPRVHQLNAYMYRQEGLDEKTLRTGADAIVGALADGRHRTRAELAGVLSDAGIADVARFRLVYLLMFAELEGLICSGAMQGRQHTYALLSERAPAAVSMDREQALAELARRYFSAHGPATAQDLAWWSSLPVADVQRGLTLAADDLASERQADRTYWFAPRQPSVSSPDGSVAYLMQGFDEYLMYGPSRDQIDLAQVRGTDRPVFNNVLVVDGQLAGNWRRTTKRGEITIDVHLYAPLSPAQWTAVAAQAQQHARFMGKPVTIPAAPATGRRTPG